MIKFETDKIGEILLGKVGSDDIAKVGEELLVFGEKGVLVGKFTNDGFHNNGLVFDAVKVAVAVVFAFASEGESTSAVDMILPGMKIAFRHYRRAKVGVGIDGDAA